MMRRPEDGPALLYQLAELLADCFVEPDSADAAAEAEHQDRTIPEDTAARIPLVPTRSAEDR